MKRYLRANLSQNYSVRYNIRFNWKYRTADIGRSKNGRATKSWINHEGIGVTCRKCDQNLMILIAIFLAASCHKPVLSLRSRSWNSWTNSTHGSNSDVKCCKSLCTWSLYDRVCSFHCSKRWWLVSIGRYVHSTRAYRYGFSTSKVSHVDNRIVVTAKNMCNSPLFFCFCRITFIRFWCCIA